MLRIFCHFIMSSDWSGWEGLVKYSMDVSIGWYTPDRYSPGKSDGYGMKVWYRVTIWRLWSSWKILVWWVTWWVWSWWKVLDDSGRGYLPDGNGSGGRYLPEGYGSGVGYLPDGYGSDGGYLPDGYGPDGGYPTWWLWSWWRLDGMVLMEGTYLMGMVLVEGI